MSMSPDHQTPAASGRVSRMGVAAMILGILGAVTSVVVIGVIPAIVAIILAIIAMVKISRRPHELGGKGFALTGLICGIVAFPLAAVGFFFLSMSIAVLLPSLGRARELANRSACAANINGNLKAFMIYGAENNDVLPIAGIAPASGSTVSYTPGLGVNTGKTDAASALYTIQTYTNGNVSASLWIPVVQGNLSPRNLVCKSDLIGDTKGSPTQTPSGEILGSPAGPQFLSYSIASPWMAYNGKSLPARHWTFNYNTDVALMADIAPLNGTGTPTRNLATGSHKTWNSGNHGGDGQNIGFADGHIEFLKSPVTGPDNDNIWTINENAAGTNGSQTPGTVPEKSGTARKTDIMMIPMRDLNTGALR